MPESIQITTRSDRSFLTALLHTLIRPFRPLLVKSSGTAGPDSPRLSTSQSAAKNCSIIERKLGDCWVYDLIPQSQRSTRVTKRIYWFAGGGWQDPPSSQHWSFTAWLANQLPGCGVTMVSYPLAPQTPAPKALPTLVQLYKAIIAAGEADDEDVVLAGDSAGGNVVLCMTIQALQQAKEAGEGSARGPKTIMLVSPACDLSNSNPQMREVEPNDPILTVAYTGSTANAWRGDWDGSDPRISPVNADISVLSQAGIEIDGIVGGWDILGPDALRFRDKLNDEGVQGSWLVWDKMMHCWPLARRYGPRESQEAADWLVDRLKT